MTAGPKVTVYQFEYVERATGRKVVSQHFATEKAINQMGACVLPATAREVAMGLVTFSGLVPADADFGDEES